VAHLIPDYQKSRFLGENVSRQKNENSPAWVSHQPRCIHSLPCFQSKAIHQTLNPMHPLKYQGRMTLHLRFIYWSIASTTLPFFKHLEIPKPPLIENIPEVAALLETFERIKFNDCKCLLESSPLFMDTSALFPFDIQIIPQPVVLPSSKVLLIYPSLSKSKHLRSGIPTPLLTYSIYLST